jgi:hypothetical protein
LMKRERRAVDVCWRFGSVGSVAIRSRQQVNWIKESSPQYERETGFRWEGWRPTSHHIKSAES